jgi:ferrochelatase
MVKRQKNVILLVNLGSIESLTKFSVAKFLFQFLRDKRVVQIPPLIWYPVLFLIILLRSGKLLKKYKKIALNEKIPLLEYTEALAKKLSAIHPEDIVLPAYLYGVSKNQLQRVLKSLLGQCVIKTLTVVPLYPQYSSTTVAPVLDAVADFYKQQIYVPKINFINEFATKEIYIKTIVNSIRNYWQHYGKISQVILVSFHSLPVKLIKAGDCYESQCYETWAMIRHEFIVDGVDVLLGFQSKFGYEKWLQPSVEQVLRDVARNGYKSVDVIAPGFICDCLETLEEIDVFYKDMFYKFSRGGSLRYIPCLNDSNVCVEMLDNLIYKVC